MMHISMKVLISILIYFEFVSLRANGEVSNLVISLQSEEIKSLTIKIINHIHKKKLVENI